MSILTKIFGDPNEKALKKLRVIVDAINSLEPEIEKLSDEDLKKQTDKLKNQLKDGKTLDDILPEAFATVRETAKRVIGQRHYDVQLMAGIVLHRGEITEMKTGEGKTLAATCPIYLNALTGKGVHLVTVNDYLARIHADWMGKIYDFLGLSVSCIQGQGVSYKFKNTLTLSKGDEEKGSKKIASDPVSTDSKESGDPIEEQLDVQYLEPCSRKQAYACDVLYGTNNEFGFDYLRDNMVQSLEEMVQRELNFAIVDEVDSILIDEARTPLIISAPDMESTDKYRQFAQIVTQLKEEEDYNIDEKMRAATLTEAGIEKVEKALGVDNIYTDRGISDVHHIEQALKAQVLFKKDKDYVVKDGEIIIIDEFTGRMMVGRRYSEGLHQAIEAKEGVAVQQESKTLATISFQNYFRLYDKLSGMTGTAVTEAEEFGKIYNLGVVVIPTNRPLIRKDLNDRIYKNEEGKFKALVKEVKKRNKNGQPVLIGTVSIEKNELISELLEREGVDHQVLNAKHHDKEAHIIAQAGKVGAVTVATNMAGRGVDIILGGHPYNEKEYKKVIKTGGLCVLGTERHESRRIDNQLRGRSGRQGDPGMSRFYISMDDDLMRIFGSDRMKSVMTALKVPDDMPIENKMISKSIETAQKKVEGNNFDIRKHLVEYDDVMNKQREVIYKRRKQILKGKNTKDLVLEMVSREIESVVNFHTQHEEESTWNLEEIYEVIGTIFPLDKKARLKIEEIEESAGDDEEDNMARAKIKGYLKKLAVEAYNQLEERVNMMNPASAEATAGEAMRYIEKGIMLKTIDTYWIDHLSEMQYLRTGIGLRGYGQRDPLVEYKREGFKMYKQLLESIDKQIVYSIYKVALPAGALTNDEVFGQRHPESNMQFSAPSKESANKSPFEADNGLEDRKKSGESIKDTKHYNGEKVGRNDPCPCGATKQDGTPIKFKNCHGK